MENVSNLKAVTLQIIVSLLLFSLAGIILCITWLLKTSITYKTSIPPTTARLVLGIHDKDKIREVWRVTKPSN